MTKFTAKDIKNLLADLELYSGNIKKVTDIFGPHEHNPSFTGIAHTCMDSFHFTATPMFCDERSWSIQLADPVESLRHGHRLLASFTFPKLYKTPRLQKKYRIANIIYDAYNNYSHVTEASRLRDYEREIGYEQLPTYSRVLKAIIDDFRSYPQKKRQEMETLYAKN